MADKRCFVQFPHPGDEHGPRSGRVWNTTNRKHKRRFMQFRGEYIDYDGITRTGDLRAWGEWEPESEVIPELDPKNGASNYPNYLWKPYWVPRNTYQCLHNTDPFVFGDCFLYSNCGQSVQNKKGLKYLDRGSVIAFGSGKEIDGQRRWVLDTVLVVKDSFQYDPLDPRKALEGRAPETFLSVTGGPLADNDAETTCVPQSCALTSERLRLYRGATPDDPVDEMFGFFPAIPADGGSCFPRPIVSLDDEYFNSSNWRAPKGAGRNLHSDTIRDQWGSLVTQVRKDGLVLGTRAEMPECRAG